MRVDQQADKLRELIRRIDEQRTMSEAADRLVRQSRDLPFLRRGPRRPQDQRRSEIQFHLATSAAADGGGVLPADRNSSVG